MWLRQERPVSSFAINTVQSILFRQWVSGETGVFVPVSTHRCRSSVVLQIEGRVKHGPNGPMQFVAAN